MAYQCAFFYGGFGADGGGSFTLLPGTEPSTAVLRFYPRFRLPQVGQLRLQAGSRSIVFNNCRLTRTTITSGNEGRWLEATIVDRRWMWVDSLFPVYGEYNRIQGPSAGHNSKNILQLATILMQSLGESQFDISPFAQIANRVNSPSVQWDGNNAAVELDNLCKPYGLFPTLDLRDRVKIVADGAGLPPQSTPQAMDFTVAAEAPPIPKTMIFEGGSTLVQHDLPLIPIGKEITGLNAGKFVPINNLSYKPALGWGFEDPANFPTVAALKPKAIQVCRQYVWRMYAVAGGFTITQPPHLLKDKSISQNDLKKYYTIDAQEQWRIFPLVLRKKNRDQPEVVGYFSVGNAPKRNNTGDTSVAQVQAANAKITDYSKMIDADPLADSRLFYNGNFSIDEEFGRVLFDNQVYFNDAVDGYVPAMIRLRTCFGLRDTVTGAFVSQRYQIATGSPFALAFTRLIKESSLGYEYLQDKSVTNESEFIERATSRIAAELRGYQIGTGASVPYKGFYFDRTIDGVVRSISFDVAESGEGTTHVDYNMERPEAYLTLRELRLRREVTYNLYKAAEEQKRKLRGLK